MLDAQAASARVSPQSQTNSQSAIPDSLAQAAKKQAEEEGATSAARGSVGAGSGRPAIARGRTGSFRSAARRAAVANPRTRTGFGPARRDARRTGRVRSRGTAIPSQRHAVRPRFFDGSRQVRVKEAATGNATPSWNKQRPSCSRRTEEGSRLAELHEQELALARLQCHVGVQAEARSHRGSAENTARVSGPGRQEAGEEGRPKTAKPKSTSRNCATTLAATEEQLAERSAQIHEQELALVRRSATLDAQAEAARIAPQQTASEVPPSSVTATPEFVAQAAQRQAEEEARLAQREARLEREAAELQSRAKVVAVSETEIAQKLAQIHEQELALARRTAVVEAQAAAAAAASRVTAQAIRTGFSGAVRRRSRIRRPGGRASGGGGSPARPVGSAARTARIALRSAGRRVGIAGPIAGRLGR